MASWLDRLLGRVPSVEANPVPVQSPGKDVVRLRALLDTRGLAGGRLTAEANMPSLAGALALIGPEDHESNWHLQNLDSDTLEQMAPDQLIRMLADLSPDISRALWDHVRLCNPGWEYRVLKPGTEDEDPAAKKVIDASIATLVGLYGSVDVVLNRLFIGAFLRGAFCAELVLDKTGRRFVDLVTPDPGTFRFRTKLDPERGTIWQAGQWQGGNFITFDRLTVRYVPIDPFPASPYGRPLASPALFTAIFLIGLMHDLRRVVSQQGYPRLDVSVNLEKLRAAMPASLEEEPSKVQEWVNGIMTEVARVYANLEPDDAYIHSDVITVNRPVGTANADSLGAVEGIITGLERMAIRALKTMPLLMGVNEAASETHANRQWEVHVAGIKSLQHLAESMLGSLFSLSLQAEGIQAKVQFRFAELRAAEMLRDAQTENMVIGNAKLKYEQGWISQDEAAQLVTGHDADQPEPRVVVTGGIGGAVATVNPEPGSNRGLARSGSRGLAGATASTIRVKIIPEGADEPLPEIPAVVEISDADIRVAINAWDTLMPDYAGLLEAVVIGQEEWDEQDRSHRPGRGGGVRDYGDASPWEWDQPSKRYRNAETGRYMSTRQMLPLRDEFIAAQKAAASELVDRLAEGEIGTGRFVNDMRGLIRTTFIDEYALAHGGRHNMTSRDFGIVGNMCRDQYGYLNNFASEINAGDLSPAQIRARANLYIEAGSQAFERAGAEVRGIKGPRGLPAYPGDGTSECMTNCKCTWEYAEKETAWECTWTLHPAEHCGTCLERASTWAPYIVAKD